MAWGQRAGQPGLSCPVVRAGPVPLPTPLALGTRWQLSSLSLGAGGVSLELQLERVGRGGGAAPTSPGLLPRSLCAALGPECSRWGQRGRTQTFCLHSPEPGMGNKGLKY